MNEKARTADNEWVHTMETLGKIGPFNESIGYTGPTVVVPKSNGGWRITHDYSGLKTYSPLYSFEQMKIEEIWQWAANKAFLTKIDAIKAFHSVPISAEDFKYYTFITEKGTYAYHVLPMGTRNSPALFAEFMSKILSEVRQKFPDTIKNYQDDVIIAASTLEETNTITKLVMAKMKEAGLMPNKMKSYLDPLGPKPLLGAIWNPKNLAQANDAIMKLNSLWNNWKIERSLRSYRRFTGILAYLISLALAQSFSN
eukprot:GHVP01034791.1.p1 GENE.GHVP01034791.1~~GHVP01034791.1.p1  ORF type:complete len:255 (+),score=17.97 GHVP01034791.1:556-1320(+)